MELTFRQRLLVCLIFVLISFTLYIYLLPSQKIIDVAATVGKFVDIGSNYIVGMVPYDFGVGNVTLKLVLQKTANVFNLSLPALLSAYATSEGVYKVGIGQNDPQCTLDVKGDICSSSSGTCNFNTKVCSTPFVQQYNLTSVAVPIIENPIYTITSSPRATGDRFGTAVYFSDSVLIVGADNFLPTSFAVITGAAFLYSGYADALNDYWVQLQTLIPFGITATNANGGKFGSSLDAHVWTTGNIYFLAVGAPYTRRSSPTRTNAGAVYVFIGNQTSEVNNVSVVTYSPLQLIYPPSSTTNAHFGNSFEFVELLNGTMILVISEPDASAGSIYIYRWTNSTQTFDYISNFVCSGAVNNDRCGFSLDIETRNASTIVLVTSLPAKTVSGNNNAGEVQVYHWNQTAFTFNYKYSLYQNTIATGNQFGYTVEISDDCYWLAVGSPYTDYNTSITDSGIVQTFLFNGSAFAYYPPVLRSPLSSSITNENFGFSIAFSYNSQKLVIGAPGFGVAVAGSGIVFVFDLSSTTSRWNDTYVINSGYPSSQSNSLFGYSVAATNDLAATGSPVYSPSMGVQSGMVQVSPIRIPDNHTFLTQCVMFRGVSANLITSNCRFLLNFNVTPGTYNIITNTSILNIPAALVSSVYYVPTSYGLSIYDREFQVKFFEFSFIEDEFYFKIQTIYHANVYLVLYSNIVLSIPP